MQEDQHRSTNLTKKRKFWQEIEGQNCVSRYIGHVQGRTCRMKPHAVRFRSGDRKSKKMIERETICKDFF